MNTIEDLTKKVAKVMEIYSSQSPDIKIDRDYYPFKITEEWGECMQAYLMLTDRGRQKGKTKEEIKENLADEMADVFGFLLLFAEEENIDLPKALNKKWFQYIDKK